MRNYIKKYSDMGDKNLCGSIIDLFNAFPDAQETKHIENHYSFTQMELKNHHPEFHRFYSLVNLAVALYKKDMGITEIEFPEKYGYESFRIKKYDNTQLNSFPLHVDVQDHASSRRFLAIFMYLNDVSEGGNTWFPKQNVSIQPELGKIVVFPPLWNFPHSGNIPISNEKYILGTYLHYL